MREESENSPKLFEKEVEKMSNNLTNTQDKTQKYSAMMSIICGFLLSMGAIHMDTINWTLGAIAADMASGASTLMVTSGFFYGMMIGHVVVAPLSDMIGKKKTILVGIVICIVGAFIGAGATGLGGLIAARMIQGLGGAASSTAARAVGGDAGKGRASAMALTFMQIFSAAIPIILPLTGKWVGTTMGWQAIFWLQAIICAVLGICSIIFVKETSTIAGKGCMARIWGEVKQCLATPEYVFFVLCFAFNMATFFLYAGSMSFAMCTELGMEPAHYADVYAWGAVAMTLIAAVARKWITPKVNPSVIIKVLNLIQVVLAAFIAVSFFGGFADWRYFQYMLWIFPAVQGVVLPTAMALVMNASGAATGIGAAFMGFVQYLFSSVTTTIVATCKEGGSVGSYIGVLMCITALCSFVCCIIGKKFLLKKDPNALV